MSKLINFIASFDRYGEPVGVNFKGQDTYKTSLGGILSMLGNLIFLLYSIEKGAAWYQRT
jgi:hypothetical protein